MYFNEVFHSRRKKEYFSGEAINTLKNCALQYTILCTLLLTYYSYAGCMKPPEKKIIRAKLLFHFLFFFLCRMQKTNQAKYIKKITKKCNLFYGFINSQASNAPRMNDSIAFKHFLYSGICLVNARTKWL